MNVSMTNLQMWIGSLRRPLSMLLKRTLEKTLVVSIPAVDSLDLHQT